MVKNLPTSVRDISNVGSVNRSGRSPGGRVLAWRISWIGEPGGLQSEGHKDSDMTEVTYHAHLNK